MRKQENAKVLQKNFLFFFERKYRSMYILYIEINFRLYYKSTDNRSFLRAALKAILQGLKCQFRCGRGYFFVSDAFHIHTRTYTRIFHGPVMTLACIWKGITLMKGSISYPYPVPRAYAFPCFSSFISLDRSINTTFPLVVLSHIRIVKRKTVA